MILILKSLYCHVEKYITICLPPEAVAYLLPVRFRIAVQLSARGDKAKALRYIDGVCRRRKEFAEVFDCDMKFRRSGIPNGPLTAKLSTNALKTLVAQDPKRLVELTKGLPKLNRIRVAAVFRALLLLRSALDSIASGKDHGKQHDAILLEIIASDFCQAVIEKPAVIPESAKETLLYQLRHACEWSLDRKVSVFMDDKVQSSQQWEQPLRDKTVKIQGPSNRPSDLDELDTDATAVVGYAGPDSLVRPVARVDVSMYLTHKLWRLHTANRLDILKDVGLPVISVREKSVQALSDSVVAQFGAVFTNIRAETCWSRINGGVELFLWVLGAGASRVAITNFDMFTNPFYPSGYIANRPETLMERGADAWRIKQNAMNTIFYDHDPSQQYSVYKCFYHHDEIKYDSVLDGIISAPLSTYIDDLERLYGDNA